MVIFDAHLDLAMNALEWNRDLTQPVADLRRREEGLADKPDRGKGTVSLPEMRRGGVGLCVATQIARYVKPGNPFPGWHSPEQAWAQTQGQLAWYRAMEARGEMAQIKDATSLEKHLGLWQKEVERRSEMRVERAEISRAAAGGAVKQPILSASSTPSHQLSTQIPLNSSHLPIGYILSLEGADSILSMTHLEQSYAQGLRALGPAHYGPGTYAQGTEASGGLGRKGRELLAEMERLNMVLDVTHLCDESFWEALDCFRGSIWASHSNCRALVPHNRQFSDEQINALIERGAVIGVALDAWMMVPGWIKRQTTPEAVGLKLERLVDHIDHVSQLAGNARHSGIGTDLDGAFGREQCPADLDTIADLSRLPEMLKARGYGPEDVEGILHRNFVAFLTRAWA